MQTDQDQRSSWMVSAAFCVALVSLLAAIVLSKVQGTQAPLASVPAKSEPYAKSQKPSSVKGIAGQENDVPHRYAQRQPVAATGRDLS